MFHILSNYQSTYLSVGLEVDLAAIDVPDVGHVLAAGHLRASVVLSSDLHVMLVVAAAWKSRQYPRVLRTIVLSSCR